MLQSHDHFKKAIAAEAMRLMDEESLSIDQAFAQARQAFARLPGYEAPDHRDSPWAAVPRDTD